jgi:hypothetical protein
MAIDSCELSAEMPQVLLVKERNSSGHSAVGVNLKKKNVYWNRVTYLPVITSTGMNYVSL